MIALTDIECAVCQTLTLMGEEYGLAFSVRSNRFESVCMLCVRAAEHINIEVRI